MTEQIILEWIEETCAAYCIPRPFAIVEALQASRATPADQVCATCNGHGMIGGPSFYAPDEGGEPCPDCATPADQEPVAWRAVNCSGFGDEWAYRDADDRFVDNLGNPVGEPLYAAPQPPQNAADHIEVQSARDAVIEECAMVCEQIANVKRVHHVVASTAEGCAMDIRRLKSAPPQKPVSDE